MRLFKQATVACGPCELGAESLDNMGEGSQLLARSLEMPLSLLAAVHKRTRNSGLSQSHLHKQYLQGNQQHARISVFVLYFEGDKAGCVKFQFSMYLV